MLLESTRPVQSALITDPEVLAAYSQDASPLVGKPEGLLRPESSAEAAAWLAEAASSGTPVTPCGLRSSTTGGGLALSGWTMSCEKLTGLLDLDEVRGRAIVAAGTVLGDFKDELATHGFLYPPDPTSEKECSIGGTVACDASGARTYRYGATHRWVRGVEVALPDGSVRWFRSRQVEKDAAGFAGLRDFVQLLCGSEGTLGFITAVEVQLVALPEAYSAGLAFFSDMNAALAFVGAARDEDRSGLGVRPRCLELLDQGSLEIMAAQGSGVGIPAGAGAAIFFEEEHPQGAEMDAFERWWALLSRTQGTLLDDTVVATDRAQQEELRALRHAVPASLNEEGARLAAAGGKKVSTDWAVPFEHLAPLMERIDGWLREADIGRFVRYGHVGNGHPHYNLIVEDAAEAARASAVVDRMCAEACSLGGTVTAEHGVGKVKLPYIHYRFGAFELAVMRGVKAAFDPTGIMAPGNLFP
jgi:FAD/FMN-containing dehydrogenase